VQAQCCGLVNWTSFASLDIQQCPCGEGAWWVDAAGRRKKNEKIWITTTWRMQTAQEGIWMHVISSVSSV
jgi:hypothetical protein